MLDTDGGVSCWGLNSSGQLGIGSTDTKSGPQKVQNLSDVVEIAAGEMHTCALTEGGDVYCWGNNSNGQVTGTPDTNVTSPTLVQLPTSARGIGVGMKHSCAILTTGSISCWGENATGQLGDGTLEPKVKPVSVKNLWAEGIEIVAGVGHTCARLSDDSVACWGLNYNGQLGNGAPSFSDPEPEPVEVQGLEGRPKHMSAGEHHTCVVTSEEFVWCWGRNADKQIHTSLSAFVSTAAKIPEFTEVSEVAAGTYHSCAALNDGSVECWGNPHEHLDAGQTEVPASMDPVLHIGAGARHNCVMTSEDEVVCWGDNLNGQLDSEPDSE